MNDVKVLLMFVGHFFAKISNHTKVSYGMQKFAICSDLETEID